MTSLPGILVEKPDIFRLCQVRLISDNKKSPWLSVSRSTLLITIQAYLKLSPEQT